MSEYTVHPALVKQFAESLAKHNALMKRFEANMPAPTPEPWYEAFWYGFCAPYRAMHAFWLVASGQGYVRRYDDDEDEL